MVRRKSDPLYEPYNSIKGRVAEAIIEELFIALGMMVKANGYEYTNPDIAHQKRHKKIDNHYTNPISVGCDFIISSNANDRKNHRTENQIFYVEVKYRSAEKMTLSAALDNNPQLILLLVSNNGFWVMSRTEIDGYYERNKDKAWKYKENIDFRKLTPLEDFSPFNFSDAEKELIRFFKIYISITLGRLCLPITEEQSTILSDGQKNIGSNLLLKDFFKSYIAENNISLKAVQSFLKKS